MFKAILSGIAALRKLKNAVDALDDDIDGNGKQDLEELKVVAQEMEQAGKILFAHCQRAFAIASRILAHVSKEAS